MLDVCKLLAALIHADSREIESLLLRGEVGSALLLLLGHGGAGLAELLHVHLACFQLGACAVHC